MSIPIYYVISYFLKIQMYTHSHWLKKSGTNHFWLTCVYGCLRHIPKVQKPMLWTVNMFAFLCSYLFECHTVPSTSTVHLVKALAKSNIWIMCFHEALFPLYYHYDFELDMDVV